MLNNHQVPLPTKPANAQEVNTNFVVEEDCDHQPQNHYYYYYNHSDSDEEEKNHDHKFLKKLCAKVEEEIASLKTSVEQGDVERNKILGLFKKFGAKLHEKMMKSSYDHHGVIFQERGVVGIEVDQKLERFKVRTVNLGTGQGEDNADEPRTTQK